MRALLQSLEMIRTLIALSMWLEVATEEDIVAVTVEEEADIVSTMRMPNRQRKVSHLEIDLKGRI